MQTLSLIDRVIQGWGDAFSYSNDTKTLDKIDRNIDKKIIRFRKWYSAITMEISWKNRRRSGGVCLLSDIETKYLDELPFRLEKRKRYRMTKNTIIISTDGSVVKPDSYDGHDKGFGGWGAVFHDSDKAVYGNSISATNNQMELMAVIEALKNTPNKSRVRIRTDSRYVSNTIQKQAMIRSNFKLWKEFIAIDNQRRIDVEWVRGHSGDQHNERADALANNQAMLARDSY